MSQNTPPSGPTPNQPRRFDLENTKKPLKIVEQPLEGADLQDANVLLKANARSWSLTTRLVAAFLLLFSFLLMVDFAKNAIWLFEQHTLLGYAGTALAGLFTLLLLSLIGREWRALRRLNAMAKTQADAHKAIAESNLTLAEKSATRLLTFYKSQIGNNAPNLSKNALAPLSGLEKLAQIDNVLLKKLDANATERVIQATRDSAVFTTMSPFALLDAMISLWRNLKMIREVAEVYGMAPGWFQTSKLLRRAVTQVVVAGGMEAGDGLLQSLFGSSVAGKLSAKMGEGLINGLMTARLGIATAELCRPLPFAIDRKPKLHEIAGTAMKRIRGEVLGCRSCN